MLEMTFDAPKEAGDSRNIIMHAILANQKTKSLCIAGYAHLQSFT